jgi:tetratricopeptide (TPR) repeat protein
MTVEYSKAKKLVYPLLLFSANIIFFIWRDNIDTLVAYQHLIINAIILSLGIIVVFSVRLFRFSGYMNYCAIDFWLSLFTLLVLVNIKGDYTTVVNNQNLLVYLMAVGVYSVIRLYSKSFADEQLLIYVFLILLVIEIGFLVLEGVYMLQMQTFSLTAFRGSFDNSGKLGTYLAILYPCALFILLCSEKKAFIVKIALLFSFGSLILFLILSFSRIAWLSVFVSSFIMIRWFLRNKKQKLLFYISTTSIAIVLILVIFHIKNDSASGRMLIWSITTHHLSDYWLKGAGYGKFASLYNLWQSDFFSTREIIDRKFYIADNSFFAFNEFLQTAVELGWAGTLLWLWLFGYALVNSFKKNLWAVSIISFLILCLASYPFREMQHQVLFFVLLALFANSQCKIGNRYVLNTNKNVIAVRMRFVYMVFIFFFSVVVFLYSCQFRSIFAWGEARNEFVFDEKKGLYFYNVANIRLRSNPEFLMEYGVRMIEADSIHTAIKALEKSKQSFVSQIHLVELGYCFERLHNYELAEKYYMQAIHISPSKLSPRYQLLLFYDRVGEIERAINSGEKILKIRSKIQSDERAELIRQLTVQYIEKFGDIKK